MRELNFQEIEDVVGGDCNYAGQAYAPGSVIVNPAGGFLECHQGINGNPDYWEKYM